MCIFRWYSLGDVRVGVVGACRRPCYNLLLWWLLRGLGVLCGLLLLGSSAIGLRTSGLVVVLPCVLVEFIRWLL